MKRGSALLIVLGMLSFMVVSAIGFSIYMRESRAPSSHLRREATARYLLKSALANAVARIDGQYNREVGRLEGVYDDVYPGLGFGNLADRDNGNVWHHRVFMPFGSVSPADTVATLTLESLAYLPPAIINEVRVFSRMTRTAKWANLAYDLGRYAFCAVDVSDCFDINKVKVNGRRTSAAGERISLAPLFPDNASSLKSLFDKAGSTPFVSLADFNIAAGKTEFTPFARVIGTKNQKIYTASDYAAVSNALFITDTWFPATNDYLTADLERRTRRLQGADSVYDLSVKAGGTSAAGCPSGQPFKDYSAANFMAPLENNNDPALQNVYNANLGAIGIACLYDYLDADSLPISLALPCTETAPMVCGLGLYTADDFKFTVKPAAQTVTGHHDTGRTDPSDPGKKIMEKVTMTKYTLEIPEMTIPLKQLVSFPFKHTQFRKDKPSGYTFKAVVKLFFAPENLPCRLGANSPISPADTGAWSAGYDKGVVTIPCDLNGTVTPKAMPTTDDTLFELNGMVKVDARSLPLFWKVEKVLENGTGATTSPQSYYSRDAIANDANRFMFFRDASGSAGDCGTLDEGWSATADAQAKADLPPDGGTWTDDQLPAIAGNDLTKNLSDTALVPHFAIWSRIEKGGDVVDLVPAHPRDDVGYAECDPVLGDTKGNEVAMAVYGISPSGLALPILEFPGSKAFKVGIPGLASLDGTADTLKWSSAFAVDPRYNFAPEDWFASTAGGDQKETWKTAVVDGFLAQDGRDRDVFMFTSDQEYLQSIGELQFLPFTHETDGSGQGFNCSYVKKLKGRYNGSSMANRICSGAANGVDFAAKDFMWRTYCAYDRGSGWNRNGCNPYALRLKNTSRAVEVVSGTGDFRVNPFSRDSRVMVAAVADTPYDYYIASTNERLNGISRNDTSRNRVFGDSGSCEQWDEIDVENISVRIRDAFLDAAKDGVTDTTEVLSDYLDWEDGTSGDAQRKIFGLAEQLQSPLHGIDRKFLLSYWRECFQNRQHLFLVFLRAEPLTVGGSTGDALANSQLGARGVALVWRDPEPPPPKGAEPRKNRSALTGQDAWSAQCKRANGGPHRTRILFYHQFE